MGAAFTVLKIDEMVRPDDVRGITHVYRHRIKTKGGTILTVEISEADFIAEKAEPILLKKAQEADKILAL